MSHRHHIAFLAAALLALISQFGAAEEGRRVGKSEEPMLGCTQIPSNMPDATVAEVLKHPEAVHCYGRTLRIECDELSKDITASDREACKSQVLSAFTFLSSHPETKHLIDTRTAVAFRDEKACIAGMDGLKTKVLSCYRYVQARIALK